MNRVLIVDDEPDNLSVFEASFNFNHSIFTAESGKEALELLEKHKGFKVIVADYKMPAMDGIELLEKVKDLYPEMVRIILTGYGDFDLLEEAINKCAIFHYLSKPYRYHEMELVLNRAVEKFDLNKQNLELLNSLEKSNEELEKKVQERTKKIERQKDELELINQSIQIQNEELGRAFEIIREKNAALTDSINYAKKIQQVILPYPEDLAKSFSDSFVIYQPKDIV